MAERSPVPCLYVLAGTNGAGKSSLAGAMFSETGGEYFNPDDAAKMIRAANPDLRANVANSVAWHQGKRLLERAIARLANFAFETTLGGTTITALLARAMSLGIEVRIWYVGLNSPELHIARVRSRRAAGGHDVPEARIRSRYDRSRLNLIRLLPKLTELRVYDNSKEADPAKGSAPEPILLLHLVRGKIVNAYAAARVPHWAKPILAAAFATI